jgi:hypothetical protein
MSRRTLMLRSSGSWGEEGGVVGEGGVGVTMCANKKSRSLWRSIFVVVAQIELRGVIIVVLGGVIIVLGETKKLTNVRSNLHSAINIPFHNFSCNPTDCRPDVKDFIHPRKASVTAFSFWTKTDSSKDRLKGNFESLSFSAALLSKARK